jgi:8-oxo-dGTP pyrophosphatase MutT (NUDIX family)
MKKLVKVDANIPWMPKPGEGRLYITDELPGRETLSTAFGFVFDGDKLLLTRLRTRDWDIPGGGIHPGETPEAAAVREVWEEAYAKVEILEMIGTQELTVRAPRPEGYRWPYPLSVQVYYLCRLVALAPFEANLESRERGFFSPEQARRIPTMVNHAEIYAEALRRVLSRQVL